MTNTRPWRIGLSGKIATGKTLVMDELAKLGAEVIDGDKVYADLIQPGSPLLRKLADQFGEAIIAADGSLDRSALGAIVFADSARLAELDQLTHPAIIDEIERRVSASPAEVVVVDGVKLFESGFADRCDETWIVESRPELQIERLMARNGLDRVTAEGRVAVSSHFGVPDVTIDNSGTKDATLTQVRHYWNERSRRRIEQEENTVSEPEVVDIYFDYTCPYVWAASVWVRDLTAAIGDQVVFNWKYFPLEQVNSAEGPDWKLWETGKEHHSRTRDSMRATVAAGQQGEAAKAAFLYALIDLKHVDDKDHGRKKVILEAAQTAGLDLEKFESDLANDSLLAAIGEDYTYGRESLGVFGTPTFVFPDGSATYLKMRPSVPAAEAVDFWNEFKHWVNDRTEVREMKRPSPPQP